MRLMLEAGDMLLSYEQCRIEFNIEKIVNCRRCVRSFKFQLKLKRM